MKIKKIFAALIIIILAACYIATFVFALTDDPMTNDFFKASIFLTVVLPVLLYAYMMIYKLIGNKRENNDKKED